MYMAAPRGTLIYDQQMVPERQHLSDMLTFCSASFGNDYKTSTSVIETLS